MTLAMLDNVLLTASCTRFHANSATVLVVDITSHIGRTDGRTDARMAQGRMQS